MSASKKTQFKVLLLGDGGVGKTCFVRKLLGGEFERKYIATLGVEVTPWQYEDPKHGTIKLTFWDCAGQAKYGGLRDGYYIAADAVIFMFDVSSASTFRHVCTNWFSDVMHVVGSRGVPGEKHMVPCIPWVVVGNRDDMPAKAVTKDRISSFVWPRKGSYFELSTKNDTDLQKPLLSLLEQLGVLSSSQLSSESPKDALPSKAPLSDVAPLPDSKLLSPPSADPVNPDAVVRPPVSECPPIDEEAEDDPFSQPFDDSVPFGVPDDTNPFDAPCDEDATEFSPSADLPPTPSSDPFSNLASTDPFANKTIDPVSTPSDPFSQDYDPFLNNPNDPFSSDPFSSNTTDPFSNNTNPVSTPSVDSFLKNINDAFSTPSVDPFSNDSNDPFSAPFVDPFLKNANDPFSTPSVDPFSNDSNDPFSNNSNDPFSNNTSDPFSSDPFPNNPTDPFSTPFSTPGHTRTVKQLSPSSVKPKSPASLFSFEPEKPPKSSTSFGSPDKLLSSARKTAPITTPLKESPAKASPKKSPAKASPKKSPAKASPKESPAKASPKKSPLREKKSSLFPPPVPASAPTSSDPRLQTVLELIPLHYRSLLLSNQDDPVVQSLIEVAYLTKDGDELLESLSLFLSSR